MKRLLVACLLVLAFASICQAQGAYTSGVTSSNGIPTIIYNGPALVTGVVVICNGTTDTDVHVLDSGVTKIWVRAEGSYSPSVRYDFTNPIYFENNVTFAITLGTTTGRAIIEYIPK